MYLKLGTFKALRVNQIPRFESKSFEGISIADFPSYTSEKEGSSLEQVWVEPRVSENPGVGLALQCPHGNVRPAVLRSFQEVKSESGKRHRPVVDAFFRDVV